ncbi:hypothetical protein XHV734_0588 [Xanthomonas hortorum pv. vitians]|nr:hypothetical protein XHV734_0588 [Xanthomonas hortorum pv. vitians]
MVSDAEADSLLPTGTLQWRTLLFNEVAMAPSRFSLCSFPMFRSAWLPGLLLALSACTAGESVPPRRDDDHIDSTDGSCTESCR